MPGLSLIAISDDEEAMPHWSEDFSGSSLDDVRRSQSENRAWSKELRLRNTAVVNSRLAKSISMDDYVAIRTGVKEDTAECRRRAAVLETQIIRRGVMPLARES